MSDQRSVAVLGSCITRDNFNSRFNADWKRWYQVGPTTNQSSMIALMSPPVDLPWKPVREMKPYGLWNVESDLSREILDLLREDQPDFVVLDFFGDVHFGVLRMADGRYLTNNRWRIHKTDLYERLIADESTQVIRWQDDPHAYFTLWTEAMDRFAAYVAEHCPRTRVVVHCGFNAVEVMEPGRDVPARMQLKGKPPRAEGVAGSRFWARLNDHATSAYGWETIDLRDEWYVSFTDHPWGAFAVHYTLDYYHRFQAELHRLALRSELPDDLAARVDGVAEAAARRVREELAFWRDAERRVAEPATGGRLGRLGRLVRREPRLDLSRPPLGEGEDHRLMTELRGKLDDEAWERVAQLPRSADEHVAWLREVWEPRVRLKQSGRA